MTSLHSFGHPRIEPPPSPPEPPVLPLWQALEQLPCEYQDRVTKQFNQWATDNLIDIASNGTEIDIGCAVRDALDQLVAAAVEAARVA